MQAPAQPTSPANARLIAELYGEPTTARQAQTAATRTADWQTAVQTAAAKMQANAPDLFERIADAATLVLTNQVTLGLDGHATVASRTTTGKTYDVNGTCPCPDAVYNTPWCAHRLAVGLVKRATKALASPVVIQDTDVVRRCPECFLALDGDAACDCTTIAPAQSPLPQAPATTTPALACPEAAFSLTLKGTMGGQDALLTVRGATWEAFQSNVQRLQGLLDSPVGRSHGAQR